MRSQSKKKNKLPKARENAGDQISVLYLIGRESGTSFFGPITERSSAKTMQSQITFDS